ncbi:hypothetical protein MLD38_007521 [Melastoma candidum]|uniref:Uncharacterized protein n=1 Tax=Melastoma candidum TaxID=119954 RepID=A0ACB9RQK9_9MYRT|nr:hypothetical protein MLD38_007521 [Melastoma candidum]
MVFGFRASEGTGEITGMIMTIKFGLPGRALKFLLLNPHPTAYSNLRSSVSPSSATPASGFVSPSSAPPPICAIVVVCSGSGFTAGE